MKVRYTLRWALFVFILLLVAAFWFDGAIIDWVNAHQNQTARNVASFISRYGDWPVFMAAGLVGVAVLITLHRRRWVRIICIMMISTTLAGGIANSVRVLSGRPRPNSHVEDGWYGIRHNGKWLIGNNRYHAFPSGHTATAFAFFLPLLLLFGIRAGAPGLLYACMVAASRIYLGVHHFSDITAAIVIGVGAAAIVCRWSQLREALNKIPAT